MNSNGVNTFAGVPLAPDRRVDCNCHPGGGQSAAGYHVSTREGSRFLAPTKKNLGPDPRILARPAYTQLTDGEVLLSEIHPET